MLIPTLIVLASLMPLASALAQDSGKVVVQPAGSQQPNHGLPQNFTGSVQVTGRFQGKPPARISGGTVTFEPSARTAWHTHPLGQTLVVTKGVGRVQHWDGPVQDIAVGDTVWIPPGVKHWHGASPDAGMTHIAIAETLDGTTVEWMEHVSDEQYQPR